MSLSKLHAVITNKARDKSMKNKKKEDKDRFRVIGDDELSSILSDNMNTNTSKSERKVNKIMVTYLKQVKKMRTMWITVLKS